MLLIIKDRKHLEIKPYFFLDKLHEILKSWGPWASNGQCLRARLFRSVYCSHVRSFLGPSSQAHNTSQCFRSDIFVWPFSSRNRRGANFYPILPFPKKERRVLLTSTAFYLFMRNWTYIFSCHSCVIYRDYKSMEGGSGIRHSVALIMGDCTSWQTINCLVKR